MQYTCMTPIVEVVDPLCDVCFMDIQLHVNRVYTPFVRTDVTSSLVAAVAVAMAVARLWDM